MKPSQNYTPEAVGRLKQWIAEMKSTGDTKYFEIFVDGMRIVHKTNDVEEFDRYKVWMGSETQQIKVLIYNTVGSHRSKPFEFRTEKYPEEKNYKDILETLEKKNQELIKRLSDAEAYIQKLEDGIQQTGNTGSFDLEAIISSFGKLTKQFPGLKDSLGGLGSIINPATTGQEEKNENFEASFRKKASSENSIKNEAPLKNNSVDVSNGNNESYTFTTKAKLTEEQTSKMFELMTFFSDNPTYIETVLPIILQEKTDMAA